MFLEKIRQVYPDLTKNQKRLADFIATSYQEAVFMTALRLAKDFSLSESTVIRFAQRIGYPGYPELVQDMQALIHRELQEKAKEPGGSGEPSDFARLLDSEIAELRRCASHVPPDLARRAVMILEQADNILVLGQDLMLLLAQLFAVSLRAIGLSAESPLPDAASIALALGNIGPESVVVGISAAQESGKVANALRYARQKGIRTLALTTSVITPCAQVADIAVICPSTDSSPIPSVTALSMILDVLLQSLCPEGEEPRPSDFEEARRFILGASPSSD